MILNVRKKNSWHYWSWKSWRNNKILKSLRILNCLWQKEKWSIWKIHTEFWLINLNLFQIPLNASFSIHQSKANKNMLNQVKKLKGTQFTWWLYSKLTQGKELNWNNKLKVLSLWHLSYSKYIKLYLILIKTFRR